MLVPAVVAPLSVLYTVGPISLAILPLAGIVVAIELKLGVNAGNPGLPEYICSAVLAGSMLAGCLALMAWVCLFRKVEVYYASFPWLNYTRGLKATPNGRTYQTRCPWTGQKPTQRCLSCGCRVHSDGWHEPDRFTHWTFGDTVLRWEPAKRALSETTNPEQGRIDLDRALDFSGNLYTNGVTGCCIGCAAWQKWLNLGSRRVLILFFGSLFMALAPWGFNNAYTSWWGVPMQVITEVFTVMWAAAALMAEAKNILRMNEFLVQHRAAIPAFQPLFELPPGSWLAWVTKHLAHTPWEAWKQK